MCVWRETASEGCETRETRDLHCHVRFRLGLLCERLSLVTVFVTRLRVSKFNGYTGCVDIPERELDLSALVYEPIESDSLWADDVEVHGSSQGRLLPASSSSRSQQMVVQSGADTVEDTCESDRQVNSSLDAVPHDDDDVETVRTYSDDGHS